MDIGAILFIFFIILFGAVLIATHLQDKRYDRIVEGKDKEFKLNQFNEIIKELLH